MCKHYLVWLHPVLVYSAPACGLGVIPVVMIAAHHFSFGSAGMLVLVTSFDFTVKIFFSQASFLSIAGGHDI